MTFLLLLFFNSGRSLRVCLCVCVFYLFQLWPPGSQPNLCSRVDPLIQHLTTYLGIYMNFIFFLAFFELIKGILVPRGHSAHLPSSPGGHSFPKDTWYPSHLSCGGWVCPLCFCSQNAFTPFAVDGSVVLVRKISWNKKRLNWETKRCCHTPS